MGGLSAKVIEVVDVLKAAAFDYIFVETVGVGQSEVEIAGLADTTVVVMVPESGDEVQAMKAGIMEIADIMVVNKADRAEADLLAKHLRTILHGTDRDSWEVPVIKTTATTGEGIDQLAEAILKHGEVSRNTEKKAWLLAEKAFRLISQKRMADVSKTKLKTEILSLIEGDGFNLYSFVKNINTTPQ